MINTKTTTKTIQGNAAAFPLFFYRNDGNFLILQQQFKVNGYFCKQLTREKITRITLYKMNFPII